MTNNRRLEARDLALLTLYSNCQLSMDVFEFYASGMLLRDKLPLFVAVALPRLVVGLVAWDRFQNPSTRAGWQRWL